MTWYRIRPIEDGDKAFVASSWLRSYSRSHWTGAARRGQYLRRVNPVLGGRLSHAYYRDHTVAVNELLDQGRTLVACLRDDPGIVLGYVCGESAGPDVAIHYVYVKDAYRSIGVAKALVQELIASFGGTEAQVVRTHRTGLGDKATGQRRWPHVPYPAFLVPEPARRTG